MVVIQRKDKAKDAQLEDVVVDFVRSKIEPLRLTGGDQDAHRGRVADKVAFPRPPVEVKIAVELRS